MNDEILNHVIYIRERIASIETTQESQGKSLERIEAKVAGHDKEIITSKAKSHTVKWLLGLMFVTIPSAVYAWVKIWKG